MTPSATSLPRTKACRFPPPGGDRSRHPVVLLPCRDRPNDPGHLIRQRDGGDHPWLAPYQFPEPVVRQGTFANDSAYPAQRLSSLATIRAERMHFVRFAPKRKLLFASLELRRYQFIFHLTSQRQTTAPSRISALPPYCVTAAELHATSPGLWGGTCILPTGCMSR